MSIGPREGGGFGLAVTLRVEDKSLPQAELAELAKEAREKIVPTRTPPAATSMSRSRWRARSYRSERKMTAAWGPSQNGLFCD